VTQAPSAPRSRARAVLGRPLVGPFTVRHVGLLLLSLGLAAFALVVLTLPLGRPGPSAAPTVGSGFVQVAPQTEGLQPGQRAPEFAGEVDGKRVELTDLDGRPIRLADLRGRPVWVNFWASWCPPCQQETPTLRALYERYRSRGLELVAISVQESTADDVRRYAQTYDLSYPIGFDATSAVFKTYRAYGLPTQIFIDREGIVRNVWRGPLTEPQAEAFLAQIL
jgi:cytochrome c biogenesis protein CcmG, thiol:disulfide interchange protein DsbE